MYKDNGRTTPAKKKEIAGLMGKEMVCPNCGKKEFFTKVEFAYITCKICGCLMSDLDMETSSKARG